MLTEQQLAEIRQQIEEWERVKGEVDPGPWIAVKDLPSQSWTVKAPNPQKPEELLHLLWEYGCAEANAKFFAHARNSHLEQTAKLLLKEVERLMLEVGSYISTERNQHTEICKLKSEVERLKAEIVTLRQSSQRDSAEGEQG